jgi:hypothetical protein
MACPLGAGRPGSVCDKADNAHHNEAFCLARQMISEPTAHAKGRRSVRPSMAQRR